MKRRLFLQSTLAAAVASSLGERYSLAQGTDASKPLIPSVEAIRGNGSKITLQGGALQELRDTLHGQLLLPQDEGYEAARHIMNPAIDKHPALIVQATGPADVRYAIDFARENALLLAVRSGGHSFSGQSTCDSGMMLDLTHMRSVRLDPIAKRAWVSGGSLLGLIDHENLAQGMATPMGTVATTGVGGLATGGGFGRIARRFGLTVDNIRSVDLITANGKPVHANDRENADLFWAVRGGGGNFGVITTFEFEVYPMQSRVVAGSVMFPFSQVRQVLTAYADYSTRAPDELYIDFGAGRDAGASDGTVSLSVCYSGDEKNADRALMPVRSFGKILSDDIKAMSYLMAQGSNTKADARNSEVTTRKTRGTYFKAGLTAGISATLIETMVAGLEPHPKRGAFVGFQHAGGAIGRVSNTATAFAHRYATHNMFSSVDWEIGADADEHMRYARQRWKDLDKHARGFYINDMAGDEASNAVQANYGENYSRLVQIKNKYDPQNLFRLNANVKPTV